MTEKEYLINEIILQCKLSNIIDGKHIPLDEVFINLVGMTLLELKTIAQELNIKIK